MFVKWGDGAVQHGDAGGDQDARQPMERLGGRGQLQVEQKKPVWMKRQGKIQVEQKKLSDWKGKEEYKLEEQKKSGKNYKSVP